ncbi:uncharacterized protein LOC110019886 isoform X2 [Phalaenopsis equestris]|uniref:uncharacterized protein LOC110019886 isoform X2 n=1 Tax=Phalaenopsis equestris TaxID=78828 RepID=UPI0009E58713|nr:uncharacterized protein LOC110019886 isoform X2 [Phalaenopsis equestris]
MAENLPPHVSDGQQWLPSAFNRDRLAAMDDLAQKLASFDLLDHRIASMDDLSQKLASFNILDHQRAHPTVKPLKGLPFYPEGQGKPTSLLSPMNAGFKPPFRRRVAGGGGGVVGERIGPFVAVSKNVYKYYPSLPVDFYLERFKMASAAARVLQRQRMVHDHESNRLLPIRSAGTVRKSSGTGVFLPRVHRIDSKKKFSGSKGKVQIQESTRNPALGEQEAKLLPSSDMGLPQDWTY